MLYGGLSEVEARDVGVILLAAGQSTRFGPTNKLTASFRGRPLAEHAAETLSSIPLGARIAVCSEPLPINWQQLGFEELYVASGGEMSASIAAGVARLQDTGIESCLIALADMPFVPSSHFQALINQGPAPVVATSRAGKKIVPARFHREMWGALQGLRGDAGARALLQDAPAVALADSWLMDIDTEEDLARFTPPVADG